VPAPLKAEIAVKGGKLVGFGKAHDEEGVVVATRASCTVKCCWWRNLFWG